MSNSASWVECRIVPDGVCMETGAAVGRLLHTGVLVEKKCAVQPESAMA